jgi:peptide/nickel transport system permease protein
MLSYLVRRLLQMIPIVFGVALLVFILFNTVGEDPVRVALGTHATPDSIAELRAKWGLDQPQYMQFFNFLVQIVTFDYGVSYITGAPLSDMFLDGVLVSLSLTAPPYFIAVFLYVSLALLIAYYRGNWFDRISRVTFVGMMSITYLVYIIFFQWLLAAQLDLFPIRGFARGLDGIEYLMLPWVIILFESIGHDIRMYRTIFLDEIKADYVRTARAKGANEMSILFRHVLKNAMIPILTYTVIGIPYLILGAFLMERFFSVPGVGDLMINAINTGDFPVMKGLTVTIAIGYSVFNLLTDILYAYVDPRVKLG